MPREFCTLFDVNYLSRGLVLHRSLRRVAPDARLWVLCMDEETEARLGRFGEPGLEIVAVADLEERDQALASVKGDRSRAEYCWTSTPALCRYLLERDQSIGELTYLDADLMFFSSPEPLFDEASDASVVIVPHRYAPQWAAQERTHGIYNVEWVTFRRDEAGLRVLDWWRDRCIEWCYARVEEGRFGDQKYLDDWPVRFPGVHVLEHPGGGLAPWNVPRHRVERRGDAITVDGGPLVFFHYHSLSLHEASAGVRALSALNLPLGPRLDEGVAWTTNYPVGDLDRELLWRPYLRELRAVAEEVRVRDPAAVRELVPVAGRKVMHPVAVAALRLGREALGAAGALRHTRRRGGSADVWKHGAAPEMLALVRAQLEAPEYVPPFRAFRYALEAVLRDDSVGRPVRLLDVGCGVGHYGELVDRWFGADVTYAGSDSSVEMIELARSTFPGRHFVVDDASSTGIDLDGYDVLLAGALIDVLADWRPVLDRLLGSGAPYVILHRQRLTDGRTRTRPARGYAGAWTNRTVLARRDLEALVASHRREFALRLPVETGVETLVLRSAAR